MSTLKNLPSPRVLAAKADKENIQPDFITGFTDAEGCFHIMIRKNNSSTGWGVELKFLISLDKKDRALLKSIQLTLGIGKIAKSGNNLLQYRVSSIKDLSVVIDHFDKYPLITQKLADFLLFKQAVELVNRKEHLTFGGLQKIVNIKASSNKGLSDQLKSAFPKTKPVSRPVVEFSGIPNPHWLVGFTNGEGCFFVCARKSRLLKLGMQVNLKFILTQHSRDSKLLINLQEYLGCGKYYSRSKQNFDEFQVTSWSGITEKIIPFFDKYPLQGAKLIDYADFKKIAELMKAKSHLSKDGLNQILKIKSGMNKGRSS